MMLNLHSIKPIIFVLLSTFIFTIVFSSTSFISGNVSSTFSIVFVRYMGGFLCLILITRTTQSLKSAFHEFKEKHSLHLVRALSGMSGLAAFLYSSTQIPVAHVQAIGLLQTGFVLIMSVFILREIIRKQNCYAILLSAIGAYLIITNQSHELFTFNLSESVPYMVSLAAAFFLGLELIAIKLLSVREHISVLFIVNFLGALISGAICITFGFEPSLFSQNSWLFALGPIALFAQFLTLKAYRVANATVLAPFMYFRYIFALALSLFIFGDDISSLSILGGFMIIAGGLWISYLHTKNITKR